MVNNSTFNGFYDSLNKLETIGKTMADSWIKVQKILGDIPEIAKRIDSQTESVINSLSVIAEYAKSIKLPSYETIYSSPALKRLRCLIVLREAEWPLYFHLNEDLISYIDEMDNDSNLDSILMDYLTDAVVVDFTKKWGQYCHDELRLNLLKNAVSLFEAHEYAATCSMIMCQVLGLLEDSSDVLEQAGVKLTKPKVKQAISAFYPELDSNNISTRSPKNKLIAIYYEANPSYLGWIWAIDYLRNTTLSSDERFINSNHPNRNKICHGEQKCFNTREHAIKAILIADILLLLGDEITKHPLP